MGDAVQPVARIPLVVERDGSMSSPELEFSPDGVLYVRQQVSAHPVLGAMLWYAPDVAVVAMVVALVGAVAVVRRVWGRPRERGRLFCRSCNYKIVPPLASRDGKGAVTVMAGARCSECGVELARKAPVIGRLALLRLWWVWGVCVPVCVVGAVLLAVTLEAKTTWRAAWPVDGADRWMGAWAMQRRDWSRSSLFRSAQLIERWRAGTGTRAGEAWRVGRMWYNGARLSPDGKQYLSVERDEDEPDARLCSIDTATGVQRELKAAQGWSYQSIVGFSADGQRVYVQAYPWNAMNATRQRLVSVDVGTFEESLVATVNVAKNASTAGVPDWPHVAMFVDDRGGEARWVAQVMRYDVNRTIYPVEVVYFDGRDLHEYTVPAPAGASSWYGPRMMDGWSALEVNCYTGGGTMIAQRVDLATGAITPVAVSSWSTLGSSPNGRFRVDKGPGAGGSWSADVVEVETGRVVARLGRSNGSAPGNGIVVSNDGKFAAVGGLWPASGSAPARGEVEVWELEGK